MIPIYKIEIDGNDVTSNFDDRALSISVTLKDGQETDDCSITIDDRDYAVGIPPRGATLKIWLGYQETGLVYLGAYEVDKTSISGPPRQMSVSGRAAGMRTTAKEQRTEEYVDTTIKDIVGKISGRHGWSAKVLGKVGDIKIPRLDQVGRSDIHILTKLARENNAFFKVADKQLIFAEFGSSPAPDIRLVETDLLSYSFDLEDRPRHKEVKSRWYDKTKGREIVEKVAGGNGEAVFELRHLFPSQEEAKRAGESKMGDLKRYEGTMQVTVSGRPEYDAGGRCSVDLREGTSGPWLIESVTHKYDGSGITTDLSGKSENGVD